MSQWTYRLISDGNREMPAVKSCVTCGDSYCRTCITPHYTDPDLERHQLQDLQQQEQQALCTEHRRELEFFCRTDQTAICSRCLLHRHKGHDAIEQVPKSSIVTKGGVPPPDQLQFAKVSPVSVTLRWSPPEGVPGPHRYNIIRRRGQDHCSLRTSNSEVEVTGLHPGQKYHFSVATLSQDGQQSTPIERFIHTELPPPDNLTVAADLSGVTVKWTKPEGVDQVSYLLELFREDQEEPLKIPVPEHLSVNFITASTARIVWQVPTEMQKTAHGFLVSYRSRGTAPKFMSTESCSTDITLLQPGTDYTVRVYTELQHGGKSQPASTDMSTGITLSELLSELGLEDQQGGKLTLSSVLEINSYTLSDTPPQGLHQLPLTFLKKLIMSNLKARNTQCSQNQAMHSCDFREDNVDSDAMNPLDVITALFHCADPFLQQEMVSKMSVCQFAVPLLLPNCDTKKSTLMLWAMRDIVKNYKPHSGEGAFVEGRIVELEIPMVSFVRVGKSSLPKSQTLNRLLSNSSQHSEAFIHHDMPCGDVPRKISNGLVEVSWYLPSGNKNIDIFTQPVNIANLRGDSKSFETQVSFLCQTSAAVFIFSDDLEGDDLSAFTNTEKKAELFLVTSSQREDIVDKLKETCRQHNVKEEHVIVRKKRNESEFVEILRLLVKDFVESNFVKTNMLNLPYTAQQILVDENSSECRNARQNAEGISAMVKNVVEFKEEQLPLHGAIWKEISWLEKERCVMRKANREQELEDYRSSLNTKELELREKQHQRALSEVMAKFITGISQPRKERLYFLTWLKMKLDTLTRQNLSTLRQQYKDCCSENPQNKEQIKKLDEHISNCSLGPEHFFRELGQVYECACSLPQDDLARQRVQNFPGLCAQMLLDGFPVELVDGDASNIPMKWISAVLTELHQLVDTKSRILVLTVLGVQSTGKSTLLNTMFGVQFAVSSGRCTRGAFMLLMEVSEELRPALNSDFIMVIDTEGLKSAELAALDTSYEHDNELATLVIGLSDITMINVAMENNQEMKDVLQIAVHAFLRMKEVGKKPICLFVHQNVSDMSAHDKNMRDRNKLVEQLNEMTQAAAKMEKKEANTKFTDVMKYDPDKDSYYIPGLWHGTPPMAPVNTGYSEAVYELRENLIGLFKSDKEMRHRNAEEFKELTDSLWKSVKFENFIFNFRNSLVADAYLDLYTHYNKWEWAFQSEMNKWLIAKTTVISNFGVTKKNVQISQLQTTLRDMLHEASVKLDGEQQKIQDNLQQYFKQNDNKVHLVEKYRQEFCTSAKNIRQQTEHSVRQSLEQAVEIRKGMEKVNTIKDKQTETIERKVLELIKQCKERGTDLPEDELRGEFDKMWTKSMSELSTIPLQQTDVHQNAFYLVMENLSAKSGRVSEILSQINLKTSGQGKFTVKEDWFSSWDDRGKRILSAIRYADKTHFLQNKQDICNDMITECRNLVKDHTDAMKRDNIDYSDTYIKELCKCIDDKITRDKISDECETYLKIHVIGFAARDFQKAHDEFRSNNDPQEHLKRSRDTFLDSFLARFHEEDQFLKKAKQFSEGFQYYVSKHLGQAIANEIKTGDGEVIYNTQTNFQFAVLKQLLEEHSFEKYKKYTTSYEAFVKDSIKQHTIQRMFTSGRLPQLQKQLLSDIVSKINHAISSPAGAAGRGIKDFIHQFCSALQDQLTIPRDAYNKFLFLLILLSADMDQFTSNLKEFIKDMEESLTQDYERRISHKDIIVRIEQLPSKPHDQLFYYVSGCGHQCPFCETPCNAGCRSHTKHESSMHRPEGLGRYSWVDSNKLVIEICTTLVISDCKFKNFRTKGEWHPYKQYREIYPDWDIAGDASSEASDYWKYVMKEFNKEQAEAFKAEPADIPDEWKRLTKEDALRGLKKTFNME
ncbi:interferon-induced very large GTPase 1-like [Engraulis encrasicolus]|uniref:interferon-induced very large GTPase 1-like n=1 Tax=Engraulis encrasicolus TaxID=184585 RepID=UPI002FD02840